MGGATRFLMLLATPFPILHPRPSLLHLARRSVLSLSPHLYLSATSRRRLRFSITASDHLHTHAAAAASTRDDYLGDPFVSSPNSSRTWHPWPEWSRLVESLNAGGDIARAPSDDDAFVESEGLPDEFVRAAIACLGSLSRKAIEVVVENGSPFLFTNGFDSVRRLRAFLAGARMLEVVFELGSGGLGNGFVKGDSLNGILQ
ncbi:Zinc finger protein VAR3, chloroplastic [Vitis vinifera]|uniref:Zinc finger protein VAR3, chloroplastic n=1 Tax=Vitis vinifera TaxID=29760 RepID=A0A438HZM0_VITVI|nr:Zinc finger protein VAR3, chloroplastic [Vitis vinifera]